MRLMNTRETYGLVAQIFHWVVALMIVGIFILGQRMDDLKDEVGWQAPEFTAMVTLHKSLGVILLFVVFVRLVVAFISVKPKPLHQARPFEVWASKIVHWALYVVAVGLPLSGWLGHAASMSRAKLFLPFGDGLFFVPKDRALTQFFYELHEVFVDALVILLVIHILGTLKHLFLDRDDTLKRMVPFWYKSRSGQS